MSMSSKPFEQSGILKLALSSPASGNPFTEVQFSVCFRQGDRVFAPAEGFYDSNGIQRVRFMPDAVGERSYVTRSNHPD